MMFRFRRVIALFVCPELGVAVMPTLERSTSPDVAGVKGLSDIEVLSILATTFAAHRNWSINTISLRAAGKGTYLVDLFAGKVGITLARRDRIVQFFDANWPADLEWPRDIPRPSKSERAA